MAILNYEVPEDTITKLAELRLKTGRFQNKLIVEAVDMLYTKHAMAESVDALKEQIERLPDELQSLGTLFIQVLDTLVI